MSQTYGFGALAPKYDARDYSIVAMTGDYPEAYQVSWRPMIKDQGPVGSCVAHATSEILEYFNYQETGSTAQLSTDFIYGMQGIAFSRLESGMYLRDACKIVSQYGDCYKATINTNTEQPKCTEQLQKILTDEIYKEAFNFHTLSYAQCKNDKAIKHALMNYGPVLASIKWHDEYDLDAAGCLHFNTSTNSGYHAIMVYGWSENGWLCQNSWGEHWGTEGTFILPYKTGLSEAWSFVDANNSDVTVPKIPKWSNAFYKAFNCALNFFRRFLH